MGSRDGLEAVEAALAGFEPGFFVRPARSLLSIQTQILKSSTARKILRYYIKKAEAYANCSNLSLHVSGRCVRK